MLICQNDNQKTVLCVLLEVRLRFKYYIGPTLCLCFRSDIFKLVMRYTNCYLIDFDKMTIFIYLNIDC